MFKSVILAETDNYWAINKPAGLAVEPVGKIPSVLDWLIEQGKINKKDWPPESRFGVVHRLDVDTSGILIWAKTPEAQTQLKYLWQGRVVEKTYLGLAVGECRKEGRVELSLKRDNQQDCQMVVWLPDPKARPALTTYRRLATAQVGSQIVSLIEAHPITGRTHQIRVHLKAEGHPIVGDKLYGDKASRELAEKLGLRRHFLHAWKLTLSDEGKKSSYTAPLPEDLGKVIARLLPDFKSPLFYF